MLGSGFIDGKGVIAGMPFDSVFVAYYNLLAMRNFESEQWGKAINNLSKSISWRATEAGTYASRGYAYGQDHQLSNAISDYSVAIDLDPRALYYVNRGLVKATQEDYSNALQDIEKALRLKPESFAALTARAEVYLLSGDSTTAMSLAEAIIEKKPGRAEGYSLKGWAHVMQSDYRFALVDMLQATRLAPWIALYRNNLSWFLSTCPADDIRSGNEALDHARWACRKTSWRRWYCLGTLAAAYAEIGDFKSAYRWQSKAVNMTPVGNHKSIANARVRLQLYQTENAYRFDPKDLWSQ